jgi:hypothetical protein
LKYRVQNNVLGVEKLKEVQKSNALKILCRASVVQVENARQRYAFPNDARRKANGRLPSRLEREKKYICRALRKNTRQRFFVVC